ncbi:MAG TPA: mechanosensitive ion channel domain-containing protein [Pyrinomonadaceae bacterium]
MSGAVAGGARVLGGALWWQGGVLGRLKEYFWFVTRRVEVGNFSLSLATLLVAFVLLLAAYVVSRTLRAFLAPRLAAHTYLDPGVQYTILRLTHYALMTAGVLSAIKIGVGADFTSLAVVFTALSVGIGFGLQFIAGDIAAGFILLFERPVRLGDFVSVTGADNKIVEGRVHAINLRTTVVVTNDRISVIVPNSKLVNQNLLNWSYFDRRTRISVPLGVASEADPELVTRTLLRAAEGIEHVLPEPKPSVQFLGFGRFTLDFRLLVWTDRPRRYQQIKSQINYRIWQLCKEVGIEIPNPQRDLTLRGGALDVRVRDGQDANDETAADEPAHAAR